MRMWQNACVNTVRTAMVSYVYFSFPKIFHNFIKEIMCIYIVFFKNLRQMFLYFNY